MQNKLFPLVLEFCFEKIYSSEDKWDIIIMFKIKTLSPMSSISEIEPIPCTARATIFWFVLNSDQPYVDKVFLARQVNAELIRKN